MSRTKLTAALALGLAATAAVALAQPPAPRPAGAPATPPAQAVVTKDPASVPAGTYKIDPNHAAVIARILHGGGFSNSVVRFGVKDATLTWNPANIPASKIEVTVDMTPHYDPIKYGQDPAGANLLNVAQFPTATFTSTTVTRTGPTTGTIAGDLTFRGVTKPVTINASLVGAGKTGRGAAAIGFTGTFKFKRSDFGMTFGAAAIGDEIEVVVDGEFGPPRQG